MSVGNTILAKTLPAQGTLLLPFSGAGANVPVGTLVSPGASAAVNFGVCIPATATIGSATAGDLWLGVLGENHVFATTGDATTQTLVNWFPGYAAQNPPCHNIDLLDTVHLLKVPYSLVSTVAVASATSTVLTITSTEANLDGGFAYVNAGTGIGELNFIKSSSTAIWTLISASNTTLDSSSKLTKILPYFHQLPTFLINTTTQATQLDSIAAIGTARAIVLGTYLLKNGLEQRLDPKAHHKMTGLNSVTAVEFYALMGAQNTAFHPNA